MSLWSTLEGKPVVGALISTGLQMTSYAAVTTTWLENKAEVLVMMVKPVVGRARQPVAIVANFLKKTPAYHLEVVDRRLLVITSKAGANRVYDASGHDAVFQSRPINGFLVDTAGRRWIPSETGLSLEQDERITLPRYVAHQSGSFSAAYLVRSGGDLARAPPQPTVRAGRAGRP